MTTEHADWPADWNAYDIKREIASMTEARLTNTLVHLRFVCQKWRSAREGKMDLLKAYESTFHRQMLTGESEAVVRRWLESREALNEEVPPAR